MLSKGASGSRLVTRVWSQSTATVEGSTKVSPNQWTPCLLFIWNDNMREKREANANATWRELIRDRPRGDGV
jgi:hypothetical protein